MGKTTNNFAKQLKSLRFKTSYQAIDRLWQSKPEIFNVKPDHHNLGLNTYAHLDVLTDPQRQPL